MCAFSPDGEHLAMASQDESVQVWPWQPESLIDQACSSLSRNLTRQEWQEYLGNEPYRKICPNLAEPQ